VLLVTKANTLIDACSVTTGIPGTRRGNHLFYRLA